MQSFFTIINEAEDTLNNLLNKLVLIFLSASNKKFNQVKLKA